MKNIITTLILLSIFSFGYGQSDEARKKIESAKIALITERLDLSPEQAEKFWPIYNEFNNQQRDLRNQFVEARRGFDPKSATEEENKAMVELGMSLKQRQVDLEKTYTDRMLRVINTRQLMSLRKAEDDFKAMLMERVRQRERKRDRLRNNQDLQEQRNQRRKNN